MILQVNNEWRIVSESQQWIVQRYLIREKGDHIGTGDWKSLAYFTRPDTAAFWLVHKRVRDLPGTYPAADALEVLGKALDAIGRDIERLSSLDGQKEPDDA